MSTVRFHFVFVEALTVNRDLCNASALVDLYTNNSSIIISCFPLVTHTLSLPRPFFGTSTSQSCTLFLSRDRCFRFFGTNKMIWEPRESLFAFLTYFSVRRNVMRENAHLFIVWATEMTIFHLASRTYLNWPCEAIFVSTTLFQMSFTNRLEPSALIWK